MATQTQVLRKPALQANRQHDYLYEPVHYLSSDRDHARSTFKAHTGMDRVKRVPVFNHMFSELRHAPRFQVRLEGSDPVPKFISRQWRGYADQQREQVQMYKTFNYAPDMKVPQQHFAKTDLGGRDRAKYFTRPLIPYLQQVPPDVFLAPTRQDALGGGVPDMVQVGRQERPPTPATKNMTTQTDYRDSEAQTDPYTPEYVVRPGEQPELLTLVTLSHGRGLPAGLAEVEMIERARNKRAWEATLPPLSDISQLEKRKNMMDEMEREEWALREREIEKLQEARLEVLKQLLKQREENQHELNVKRLDRLWSRKQKDKEEKVKKIRFEYTRALRKLAKKHGNVENKLSRRDLTSDYVNMGSEQFAPTTRLGVFPDRNSENYLVRSRYLNTLQGLMELEQSMPTFVLNPRVKAPKPKTVTKAGFVKRKQRQEMELAQIHQTILELKNKGKEPPKPLRFLQKIEKPVPRPPTPQVEVPSEMEEERELATIFLQQVIRGRAIQNMMFEGKEKRMELIKELRSTHALQTAENDVKKKERQQALALQRQRRLHEHRESHVDEVLSQLEGQSMGDTLDFLSKELIRLQEERRIHAFSMLAERRRRIREAEESGRRQVEERRRREEDEIFKQTVKVHQDTVDTYLEDVIMTAVDVTADTQARAEIRAQADTINDIAYELEDKRDALQSEEIVAELVHTFLIPEVQKKTMREKIRRQQRQFLLAAHREISSEGEPMIESQRRAVLPTPSPVPEEQPPKSDSPAHSSPASPKQHSAAASPSGSKQATPTGSKTASPTGSKTASPAGSKKASPRGSKEPSPVGSRTASPNQEKQEQEAMSSTWETEPEPETAKMKVSIPAPSGEEDASDNLPAEDTSDVPAQDASENIPAQDTSDKAPADDDAQKQE